MFALIVNSVWARKRRLVRTGVAVVIGVAFLSGTLVLGDTLRANFDRLFTDVSAGTDVVVRNATSVTADGAPDEARGPIDASLVDAVRDIPGVAAAEGQVVGYGTLLGADGDPIGGNGPPRLAGSWITDDELNPYELAEGRAPRADDEVVVNRGAAEAGDLQIGDTATVQTPDPVQVRIVGISTFGGTDGLGDTTWTAFTPAGAAAHVSRSPGEISNVLATAEPGTSSDDLRDRVDAALGDDVEAITGTALADERIEGIDREFLGSMTTFLTVFALVAVLVATLTIANSFSITMAQRTRELALLRAVGASRRQIRRQVTGEAVLIGTVASLVGVVAGLGVAGLLKGLFDAFGGALPAGGLTVTVGALAAAAAVGIGATLLAAQMPARSASNVSVVAALRDDAAADARSLRRRLVAGGTLVVGGLAGGSAAALGGSVAMAAPAAVALVVGALLVAPAVLPGTTRVIAAPLRWLRGTNARLAERNARRDPRRSAATATAMVVGVAIVTLFTVFASSVKTSLGDEVAGSFAADLSVNTEVFGGARLSPRAADELAALPEVDRAVPLGGGTALVDGASTEVTTTDPAAIESVVSVELAGGSLDDVGRDGLAVSSAKADDEGWRVGDDVPVTFADGRSERMAVRAVYDRNELLGGVVVGDDTWTRHVAQPTHRTVLLDVADGVDEASARDAVTPVAVRYGGDVQDRGDYVAASTAGLDMLLGVIYVLLALAVLIALVGIANALSLAVHERRHEIGLLRAVGQTRRQVRSVLRLEAVIVSVFGTLTGLALGTFLGWVLFAAVTDLSGFDLPSARLAVIAVLGALAGALAARRPARTAARLPVLDAIASP